MNAKTKFQKSMVISLLCLSLSSCVTNSPKESGEASSDADQKVLEMTLAARSGNLPYIKELLKAGVDPFAKNKYGYDTATALIAQVDAKLVNSENIMVSLFEKGAYQDKQVLKWNDHNTGSYLCKAIEQRAYVLAEKLIEKKLFINDLCELYSHNNSGVKESEWVSPLSLALDGAVLGANTTKSDRDLDAKYGYMRRAPQNQRLVLLLIEHGADVNPIHRSGRSWNTDKTYSPDFFHNGLLTQNRSVILSLLNKGAKPAGFFKTDFLETSKKNKWNDITKILETIDVERNGEPVQVYSEVKQKLAGLIQKEQSIILAEISKQIEAKNNTPLVNLAKAAAWGKFDSFLAHLNNKDINVNNINDVVSSDLLDNGADRELRGMTPLGIALLRKREDIALALLERGANPNTKLKCALDLVNARDDKPTLSKLKAKYHIPSGPIPVSVNNLAASSNTIDCSAIVVATHFEMDAVVHDLIKRGVSVNTDYPPMGNLLNYTLANGNIMLAKQLLALGAIVSKKAGFGKWETSPFQLTISFGIDVLRSTGADNVAIELLQKGSDFGPHLDGRPALFYAVDKDNAKMITALVNKKADINAITGDNRTALVHAAENKKETMIALLRKHGAKDPRSYDNASSAAKQWHFNEAHYWLGIAKVLHFNEKRQLAVAQIIRAEQIAQAEQEERERLAAVAAAKYEATKNQETMAASVASKEKADKNIEVVRLDRRDDTEYYVTCSNGKEDRVTYGSTSKKWVVYSFFSGRQTFNSPREAANDFCKYYAR